VSDDQQNIMLLNQVLLLNQAVSVIAKDGKNKFKIVTLKYSTDCDYLDFETSMGADKEQCFAKALQL
jgi:hypothetical protein